MREIIFDTETTGLSPEDGHRVVEIGCVEVDNRLPTGKTFHTYVDPERPVPKEAYDIHGLSSEFLAKQPKFHEIAQDFLNFIGSSKLIAHNAAFDSNFINFELNRIGLLEFDSNRIIDTVRMAREKFPGSSVSLDALCKRFNINATERIKHGALIDASLLAEVYLELNGGRQPALSFKVSSKRSLSIRKIDTSKLKKNIKVKPVSQKEKNDHEVFISRIPNSIWKN